MSAPWQHSKGYWVVWAPGHAMAQASGYAYEHRVVYHDRIAPLTPQDVVHHIDECKDNNDPLNLYMGCANDHGRIHLDSARARRIAKLRRKC